MTLVLTSVRIYNKKSNCLCLSFQLFKFYLGGVKNMAHFRNILRCSCFLMLTFLLLYPASADIITVGKEAGYNFTRIQAAIDFASQGDEIVVYHGTYFENIQIKGKNIILRANTPISLPIFQGAVIDGDQNGSVVSFSGSETSECILSEFVIMNGVAFAGGGIMGNGTGATIRGNYIIQNNAYYGGGIFGCLGMIENNVIAGNSASANGGGISTCFGTIRNNTICNNSAEIGGGLEECHCPIVNCIIWGNTAPTDSQISDSESPAYCCIQDWKIYSTNIIYADPKLLDPANWDYRIPIDSPCIDAGCNIPDLNMDLEGDPRPYYTIFWDTRGDGSYYDIGAYELIEDWPHKTVYVPSNYPTIQSAIDAASHGDEIIVGPGTYKENIKFNGKNIILRSYNSDVSPANDVIIEGGHGDLSKNGLRAVTFKGRESSWCTLSGFVITLGYGGVNGKGCKATIKNNKIFDNYAFFIDPISDEIHYDNGGGLASCDGLIYNNIIFENMAHNGAGMAGCDGTIMNNTIYNNDNMLGVGCLWICNGRIINNLIYNNGGGGIYSCEGSVSNNTLYNDNIYYCTDVKNCILWGNVSKCNVSYSCLKKWVYGESGDWIGMIYQDPQFIDPENADFRLKDTSPCIDAGAFIDGLSQDLDGNPRPYDAIGLDWRGDGSDFDMGAYEFIAIAKPETNLPWAKVYTPEGVQGEYVDIEFDLFDPDSEPTSIYVRFSLDGGVTWDWAWITCNDEPCSENLSTSPEGKRHSFTWWAYHHTGDNLYNQTRIGIYAFNSKGLGPHMVSGNFTVDNRLPESWVEVQTPYDVQGEFVDIDFDLYDNDSEPSSIWAKFSLDGGATWDWARPYKDPQTCMNNLASSPQGTSHTFPWWAGRQAKCNLYDQVRIQIGPYNSKGYGKSDFTDNFTVDNLFQPPRAKIYASDSLVRSAYIPVYYSLFDCTGDPTDIYVKYSTNRGETWNWITHAPGGDGTSNLATSEEGVIHQFIWNAAQDLGNNPCSDCKLLMYTKNTKGSSGPWYSDVFSVDNPVSPWVRIYKPESNTGNKITVYYHLFDYQSVATSIYVRYSIDNGETWNWCNDAQGGDSKENLAASPEGVLHAYNWDAVSNIGCSEFDQLVISILPYNSEHGYSGFWQTDPFSGETCK